MIDWNWVNTYQTQLLIGMAVGAFSVILIWVILWGIEKIFKKKNDLDKVIAEIEESDRALRFTHNTLNDMYGFMQGLKEKGVK